MATASRTWSFAANAEGLADLGDSASLGAAWSAADGNPAGSLEWIATTGASQSERARGALGDTWESLFGIPAGSTVTDVQVTDWDELRWGSNGITARRVRMRLVDTAGVSVHSGGDLVDVAGAAAGDGGTPHAMGAGTLQAVDAGKQASGTEVRLEIQFSYTGTPTGAGIDYEQDNIDVQITYSTSTPPVVQATVPAKLKSVPSYR